MLFVNVYGITEMIIQGTGPVWVSVAQGSQPTSNIWFLRSGCHLPGTDEDNEIFMSFLKAFGKNVC